MGAGCGVVAGTDAVQDEGVGRSGWSEPLRQRGKALRYLEQGRSRDLKLSRLMLTAEKEINE